MAGLHLRLGLGGLKQTKCPTPSEKASQTPLRGQEDDLWYQSQEGYDFLLIHMQFLPFTPSRDYS